MRQVGFIALVMMALFIQGCASKSPIADKADIDEASRLYTDLGLGYMQQGMYERAMAKLKKAIEYKDSNATAHHYLAEVYKQIDDPEFAEKHYLRATKLAPNDASILNNYGAFLCSQSRFEDSEKYFLKAVATPRYRTPELSYENIALCAMRVDNSDKAVEYFRKALEVNPGLPKSLFNLAQISYSEGNFLQARAFLQRLHRVRGLAEQGLRLGIKVETALGDAEAVARYHQILEERSNPTENINRSMGTQ